MENGESVCDLESPSMSRGMIIADSETDYSNRYVKTRNDKGPSEWGTNTLQQKIAEIAKVNIDDITLPLQNSQSVNKFMGDAGYMQAINTTVVTPTILDLHAEKVRKYTERSSKRAEPIRKTSVHKPYTNSTSVPKFSNFLRKSKSSEMLKGALKRANEKMSE